MRKLKYQGGLTKLITSTLGKKNKEKFIKNLDESLQKIRKMQELKPITIDVVSFSSSKDFYDQCLSILSFLRYIGNPDSWTIYSDGSHSEAEMELFKKFGFVQVIKNNWSNSEALYSNLKSRLIPYCAQLIDYAIKYPLGKKLYSYLNHSIHQSTLFLDADILFYKKAGILNHILSEKSAGWYLPDHGWGNLDTRYKENNSEQLYQINSGFFVLNSELKNLEKGLEFLKKLQFKYEYFTEQNVFHILFKENHFMPLDPRVFVLSSEDQFDFSYLYEKEEIAMRHYTGPVRHKMWQRDWKWQLSLS